ncbi:MAG: peptidoglycan-associated lipoprotein Pal [Deltaproteobacteria bacterium]|nr:peptidoglycan-associated lipoprotein Pal [Deltaproteobacteria bacterium]
MKKLWMIVLGLAMIVALGCAKKKPETVIDAPTMVPVSDLNTVYFDFDESTIRDDQVDTLLGNAAVLKDGSMSVTVEGHCDERGTNEYNLALGDRRARGVKDYLVNLGVDSGRMSVASYGEERPVCMEHDESCWWQNRRAQFLK